MRLYLQLPLLSLFFLSLHKDVKAQSTEKLTFSLSQKKVVNSLYNKTTLIDIRPDTLHMGMIQTGVFNKPTVVIAKEPLNNQFNNILAALIDNTAKSQELVIQLRRLDFAEVTGAMSEKGYFFLNAQLFAKAPDGYKRIGTIDTVAKVSSIDVSNALLKKGGETVTDFIAENLLKQPSSYSYSYDAIEKVDSIEKSNLTVYNTNTYTDGYYLNYTSFSSQIPDGQIVVDGDEVKPGKVKVADNNGKLNKIKSQSVYAIVHKGKPYVVNTFGYYPVSKSGNDFYFTGRLAQSAKSGVVASGAMYGAIGGAIAGAFSAAMSDQIYDVKIYYLTGDFIRLKEATRD